eukprot:jgi/Botrbrau1/23015/Bobra.136_1s0007.1
MEFDVRRTHGEITEAVLKAKLETDYESWLASRRVCWDLLSFLFALSYGFVYHSNRCPHNFHFCGYSIVVIYLLSGAGIILLLASKSYAKMRQYIFLGLWYAGAAGAVFPHLVLQRAANLAGNPGAAFATLALLKIPLLITLPVIFPIGVEWAPLVHFPVTILTHIASVHAAGQYRVVLQHNAYVQALVAAANAGLLRFQRVAFMVSGEPPLELAAELELPEAFLSASQCVVGMWVLTQAGVTWVFLLLRAREELSERRDFLGASRLRHSVRWDSFRDNAIQLAAMHILVCVHLIAVCPLLVGDDRSQGFHLVTVL